MKKLMCYKGAAYEGGQKTVTPSVTKGATGSRKPARGRRV